MMTFLRGIWLSFIGFVLLSSVSIGLGSVFPVPIVVWASSLHDTRTGVDYPVQQSNAEGTRSIISGVQLVPSPENSHLMTITTNQMGLDIQVADAEGILLYEIRTLPDVNINNALWISDDEFLLLRVILPSGDLRVTRYNVASSTGTEIATVDSNLFIASPYNQWILLNDSSRDTSRIINTLDGRTYDVDPVYRGYAWSDDERYFASGTQFAEDRGFQLLDTNTGNYISEQVVPTRLLWSRNNRDLIIQDEDEILLYREMQLIGQAQFQDEIVHLMWSPDGDLAWILIDSSDAYDLYLVNIDGSQQVRFIATVPRDADLRTFVWAQDSPIVTYSLGSDQRNVTDIYRVQMLKGELNRLTSIAERVGQVRYLETLDIEEYKP